jgi:glycosyltransferase involved in cell wall biosynthesis
MSFISTYEGFGMPILEAQATGTPIVTSNISPMKDIAGKGAILVNPYDEKSIVNGYRTCLLKENVHRLKIEAGENIKRFKIESIIRMYMNIYSIIN